MAQRYSKSTNVGGYLPMHFNASQAKTAIDGNAHGHVLGYVTAGTLGSGLVITLYNGTTVIGVLTPTQAQTFLFDQVCDQGLSVQLAGSGFDVNLGYLPNSV